MDSPALTAFHDEAHAFAAALSEVDWDRPTRCTPWCVRDVVGHVVTVLGRVPDMVAAPAPDRADTTTTGYYRADERFSAAANADRVRTAHDRGGVSDPAGDLRRAADEVVEVCRREPADRVVLTRHGDAMLLSDFLLTRLFETAVHGLDVADALERPPWLTAGATEHLLPTLFGQGWADAVATLGGDDAAVLRMATGRHPVSDDDGARLAALGLRPLTVG
ncbi:TIGR03083 family protein [Asanoa hainanensis]|uniref:TIGR03083 family protein n=1 Tax=Asanoa hainanensis TaxID=560556 RepID=A0A239G4Q1_9ACTN|nr:maleylpyruvate isomerase N-terminal domain-containing protein [Asanoa hainanensis]SNS64127.1 TIGR03083 family protein [Asanoa hainanensis]